MRAAAVCAFVAAALAASADPHTPLFSGYDPLNLRIEAPLSDLFGHKSIDDDYSVTGTLAYSDVGRQITIRDVTISVRGHTSRREGECTFPKLKLDFQSADVAAPLFAGVKSIKLGTHCGESTDEQLTERFGRLPNQHSPLREALVYRLLDVFGVPTLRARPAHVTYIDTQTPQKQLQRDAVVVESDGDAERRLGGRHDVPPEQFTNARDMFSVEDSARLAFAEAMIGNFDWCLKFFDRDTYRCDARRKLWNVTAVALDGGGTRPLIYDFDVSGMVAGKHAWFGDVFNTGFSDSGSHVELEVVSQVQRTRSLFDRRTLDATRAQFVARKAAAYDAVATATVDERGRELIHDYLDRFFAAIESDAAFYRRVVTTPGAKAFADPGRASIVCAALGNIPVGTPVSIPLDTRDGMIQVVLLDALWKWAPPAHCAEIHKSPVWIAANAVSSDYPEK